MSPVRTPLIFQSQSCFLLSSNSISTDALSLSALMKYSVAFHNWEKSLIAYFSLLDKNDASLCYASIVVQTLATSSPEVYHDIHYVGVTLSSSLGWSMTTVVVVAYWCWWNCSEEWRLQQQLHSTPQYLLISCSPLPIQIVSH